MPLIFDAFLMYVIFRALEHGAIYMINYLNND
jgi:hypothetical protein